MTNDIFLINDIGVEHVLAAEYRNRPNAFSLNVVIEVPEIKVVTNKS